MASCREEALRMFAVLRGDRDTALANIPVVEIIVTCFMDTNDDDWLKSVRCCLTLARLFLQGLPECGWRAASCPVARQEVEFSCSSLDGWVEAGDVAKPPFHAKQPRSFQG